MTKYKAGQSGNPKGRPAGKPDRRREFRELIRDAVPELIQKALDLARAGDAAALRLLLDRALPSMKPQAESAPFAMPEGGKLSTTGWAVLASVAAGDLAPDIGKALLDSLAAQSQLVESDELVRRIEALEAKDAS